MYVIALISLSSLNIISIVDDRPRGKLAFAPEYIYDLETCSFPMERTFWASLTICTLMKGVGFCKEVSPPLLPCMSIWSRMSLRMVW